jgi:hypothetical protein
MRSLERNAVDDQTGMNSVGGGEGNDLTRILRSAAP